MAADSDEYMNTIRILHVDDEPEFAELTATYLGREDPRLEVETAENARDGLARLADATFDCIVSDYDMPDHNGIEFLERIREDHPALPFILFTGKGSEQVASDAISAGATDYLQKETGTDQYTLLANRIGTAVEKTRVQRQRERYLEAIETADEGIALFDSEGFCRYANERYGEIYAAAPAELRGRHWEKFYPSEEIPYVHSEIMPAVNENGYWHGQTTNIDADEETFEVDHTVSTTGNGGLVCTVRSLSKQNELERRLSRYETFVEALDDPVYICDEDGRFQYVNDAFVDLVGYDRERIMGSDPRLVKSEESAQKAERKLGRLLSSDGPESVTFEVEIQPRGRDPIPCEDHMGVLPYDGPRFNGSAGVLRDVSARKRRERRLERQNRRLDEFVSVVSHDLRNPLNQATGYLELARDECQNENLDTVAAAHERMETLIEDLLTLARNGDRVQEPEAVDLSHITETSWGNVETGEAELSVKCHKSIRGDVSRVRQLFENLIRNAVEHGGDDVTITVGDMDGGFYVADDGRGIPEDKREEVFDMGYSTAEAGTGFGLAIVKQVAEAHGWEVSVTTASDGGARFEVTGVEFDDR